MAKIDEDLQSRQMAVYGRESMLKLSGAKVLVSGLNGLGAEVAKNVILANVKAVTLHDSKPTAPADLGSNFYLSESDVGKNRAAAAKDKFQELNPSVEISVLEGELTPAATSGFSVVVLCDATLKEAVVIDKACRQQQPPASFIYGACHGAFGTVFCDFGNEFVCHDTTGEAVKSGIIHSIQKSEKGKQALVQCVQDEEIDFDDGDFVTFKEINGMTELNNGKPQQIFDVSKGKKNFKIADTSGFSDYVSGGIVTEEKMLKILKFRSLKDCLSDPGQLHDPDTSKQSEKAKAFDEAALEFFGKPEFEKKFGRSGLLLLALRAVDSLGEEAAAPGGAEKARAAALAINESLAPESKVEELEARLGTVDAFARCYGAVVSPMAAIFGGVIGQEVIKACTAKFHPTFQWFTLDAEELVPKGPAALTDAQRQSRYAAQIQTFGEEVQKKVQALRLFLVGSGALGCEFLKAFAMMGAATEGPGLVTVTDDDVIEKSNLSRQFLFRNHNIGQSKSESASNAAKAMNPALKVRSLTERVQPATENIFDTDFWDGLDVVVNALDNIKARLYVDKKCVFHTKPLLESGTLGPKSNTQVVFPHKTENYGASRDPPEKEAPQCALHNFPHNIDHCLGLARSEFVGNFETVPKDATDFSKAGKGFVDGLLAAGENAKSVLDRLTGDPAFNCAMSGGLVDALVDERPASFADCVAWARRKYQSYFVDRVKLLVHNCPEDMKTESGTPFWAPPKRFPHAVPFNENDAMAMKFITAAANLRAKMFGIDEEKRDPAFFKEVLKTVTVPDFKPFKTKVKTEADEGAEGDAGEGVEQQKLTEAVERIQKAVDASKTGGREYFVNEFEKDHDLNFHIDFIQSFANLRARNYAIDEVDFLQAKLKAGRIIPAIATATALATGFVCFELLKVVAKTDAAHFRNTFSNLALPLFSQSEPAVPEKVTSGSRFDPAMQMDVDEVAVPDPQTVWDSIVIKAPRSLTIKGLIDWFKAEKKLTLDGWMYTDTSGKADSTPLSSQLDTKVVDYLAARGFPCDGVKKVELGDSPPDARVLELRTEDDEDVKICRVILEFTD